jgi:hypothetical protein
MATPLPRIRLISAGTILSLPESVQLTGTISSSGTTVTGTGTLFLTEIRNPNNPGVLQYQYLFKDTTGEIMEILSVNSDTHLELKTAFAAPLAGDDVWVVNNYFLKSISIMPLGAGVRAYTPGSTAQAVAQDVGINIKEPFGIPNPIGLNCVADTEIVEA